MLILPIRTDGAESGEPDMMWPVAIAVGCLLAVYVFGYWSCWVVMGRDYRNQMRYIAQLHRRLRGAENALKARRTKGDHGE